MGALLRFLVSWLLRSCLFAGFFAYVFLGTIASFVSPSFYTEALVEEGVYDRVYDDVLVDPALQETQEELLGGLEVPAEEFAEVARRVLPPNYLREETERTITTLLSYLKKDRETLELNVNLETPLVGAKGELISYVWEHIATMEVVSVDGEGLEDLTEEAFRELRGGRLPKRAPSVQDVPVEERLWAYDQTLRRLRDDQEIPEEALRGLEDPETDAAIREALTREGDGSEEGLREALKLASESMLAPLIDDSLDQLRRELATPQETLCSGLPAGADLSKCTWYDLLRAIAPEPEDRAELLAEVDRARDSIATADKLWPWLPLLVMALAAAAGTFVTRGRPSALRGLGFSVTFTGLVTLVLGQVATRVGIPALDSRIRNALDYPELPKSVLDMVLDVTFNLASDLISTVTVASVAMLVIGVAVFGSSFLFGRNTRERETVT